MKSELGGAISGQAWAVRRAAENLMAACVDLDKGGNAVRTGQGSCQQIKALLANVKKAVAGVQDEVRVAEGLYREMEREENGRI